MLILGMGSQMLCPAPACIVPPKRGAGLTRSKAPLAVSGPRRMPPPLSWRLSRSVGERSGARPPLVLGSSQGLRGLAAGQSRLVARPVLASARPRPPPKLNLPSSSSLYSPKPLSWPAGAPSRLPVRNALLPPPLLLPPGVPAALRALMCAGVPGLLVGPLPFAAPLSTARRLSLSLPGVRLGLRDAWPLASAPRRMHAQALLRGQKRHVLQCAG